MTKIISNTNNSSLADGNIFITHEPIREAKLHVNGDSVFDGDLRITGDLTVDNKKSILEILRELQNRIKEER